MGTKGKSFTLAFVAIAAVLMLSVFVVASNYVRWNPMLEECVYFHTLEDEIRGQCYVAEPNCENRTQRNINKDVDVAGCYYTPRNALPQQTSCDVFTEGDRIVLNYEGTDPDADIGPAGELIYTIGEPFDEENTWQTERGDAGRYDVEVSVTDGEFTESTTVCFEILKGNAPPVLTVSDLTVEEGSVATLTPTCSDPDGDAVTLTFTGDMEDAVWTTGFDDAGEYSVTIRCSDGELDDTETVAVTVTNVDRAPELSVRDVTVREGETVRLRPSCVDPDGMTTRVAYAGGMASETWTTGYDDAGSYDVTVTCTDETGESVSDSLTVTVEDRNRPPMITAAVTLA